jgi:hypothetical protein
MYRFPTFQIGGHTFTCSDAVIDQDFVRYFTADPVAYSLQGKFQQSAGTKW